MSIYLDHNEAELALVALRYFVITAGKEVLLYAPTKWCQEQGIARCNELIGRIEQCMLIRLAPNVSVGIEARE